MEKNYTQKRIRSLGLSVFFMMGAIFLTGCEESVINKGTYNPDVPVVVTKFEPSTGGALERILIYGSNFGNDKSKVQVFFNGTKGVVIGVNDGVIYATAPARAGTGPITVKVGDDQTDGQVVATTVDFDYQFKPQVRTVAGKRLDLGNSETIDGPIETAMFSSAAWLTLDQDKNLYIIEGDAASTGLRFIDKDFTSVRTKIRRGSVVNRLRTAVFNQDFSTLYIVNRPPVNTPANVQAVCLLTSEATSDFTSYTSVIFGLRCSSGALHPVTGEYFYNFDVTGSKLYKWDAVNGVGQFIYDMRGNDNDYIVFFNPSGDYAYFVVANRNIILKAMYNWDTGLLEPPTEFAGSWGNAGYTNGIGTAARFNRPFQGAFDENDNFYVTDAGNHRIRKITPDGEVTLFAGGGGGTGGQGSNDGTLTEARFDGPLGLAYDKDNKVFYVADTANDLIRIITTE